MLRLFFYFGDSRTMGATHTTVCMCRTTWIPREQPGDELHVHAAHQPTWSGLDPLAEAVNGPHEHCCDLRRSAAHRLALDGGAPPEDVTALEGRVLPPADARPRPLDRYASSLSRRSPAARSAASRGAAAAQGGRAPQPAAALPLTPEPAGRRCCRCFRPATYQGEYPR
jgi:hypothetical protein